MKAKLWTSKFLPIVLLVAGSLLAALASWHLILFNVHLMQGNSIDLWYSLLQAWFLGLAAYLISTGLRKMRDANVGGRNETPRFGWGQILVGTFLIMSCSYNLLHPSHNRFEYKPSDEVEAENVKKFTEIFTYGFMLAGATLIILGARARFKKPAEAQNSQSPD